MREVRDDTAVPGGWGGGRGLHFDRFHTGMLRLRSRPLTLSHTNFEKSGHFHIVNIYENWRPFHTPFLEKVPLSYTSAWERYPFRAERPRIVYFRRVQPPPPLPPPAAFKKCQNLRRNVWWGWVADLTTWFWIVGWRSVECKIEYFTSCIA